MSRDLDAQGFPTPLHYERSWDFTDQPQTFSFPLETVTAGAGAGDDVSATLVGVIPAASRIVGGYLVASIGSAGIDGDNTSAWVITAAGVTMVTTTLEADLVADTPVALSTPTLTDVAAGSAVKLAITNGTTADLNSAVCHVSLELADRDNYPAPGLKVIAPDGGTCVISDGERGELTMSPGSADNGEIYVVATTETIKLAAGRVWEGEIKLQFSEANTDDANVGFGFANAVGENMLIDDGGGPRATGDYVAIWKVDGGTKWRVGAQSNGTQTPTTDADSDVTAGGTSHQWLRCKVTCETATRAYAEFEIAGVNIACIHFDYASATEMQLFAGCKNGGANAETLVIDGMGYASLR